MPSDPVNVEFVGGTNPWHDHRVMLVSPEIVDLVRRGPFSRTDFARIDAFRAAFDAAPRVHADDDAIRWLTNRQAPGENHAAR